MPLDYYLSAVKPGSDVGAVFEADEHVSCFYKCKISKGNIEVLDSISIWSGMPPFNEFDLKIILSDDEHYIGLQINSDIWAVFCLNSEEKYFEEYKLNQSPSIPATVRNKFRLL